MKSFFYSPEWYAEAYSSQWIDSINSAKDLKEFLESKTRNSGKLLKFFPNQLRGRVLELGFNAGVTTYNLGKLNPELEFTLVDWNYGLGKLVPYLHELLPEQIRSVHFSHVCGIEFKEEFFDYITAFDFFEHLPQVDYADLIPNLGRWLKVYGSLFFEFGHIGPGNPEHILYRTPDQAIKDFVPIGFREQRRRGEMVEITKIR